MNIILLSGGSGKRLWPLSNNIRSKQFIKILKNDDGDYESMVQKIYRKLLSFNKKSKIVVATSKNQVSVLHNQFGKDIGISVEPERRDTFPAILLAAVYMKEKMNVREDEVITVCPVDPCVDDIYFSTLKEMNNLVKETGDLVLMGIEPTKPSEKFGYIIPQNKNRFSKVKLFKEKPNLKMAEEYIKSGALWNGGVFAFRLEFILRKAHEFVEFDSYQDLYKKYNQLDRVSFDFAIVEKEKNAWVIRCGGTWHDLGTWDELTDVIEENVIGNAILNDTCDNVHIINELDIPMICVGLKDIVAIASLDGILISDRKQSAQIKPYVDRLDQIARYQEKSYGVFRIIDIGEQSMTIKVDMDAGKHMNYHSHDYRDEVYTVIEGEGRIILDNIVQMVSPGKIAIIPAGVKHTVIADTDLKLIEVQLGKKISINDKRIFEWDIDKMIINRKQSKDAL